MKRIVCILLCLMMVALCAACGEEKSDKDADKTTETQATTEEVIEHPVPASWFDDAVFVGDSITLKLDLYCQSNPDALGEAEFFCGGSLSYNNALWDLNAENAVHPQYRGEVTQAEYCAEKTGADKVFIMLGMNDVALYGVDGTGDACKQLVERIKSHTPDVKIYLQSTTPILKSFEYGDLNNATIDKFNVWLKQYCEENDYKYLDINSIMRGEDGSLKEEYCSDPDASLGGMGIHFTEAACEMWVDYLKNNV